MKKIYLKNKLKTMWTDATVKSSFLNMLTRPLGMLLSLVYTPLLLNYLGTEANGVWSTLGSIIVWIGVVDLGIGNGLRNLLTKEISQDKFEDAQRSVSTAYIILSLISLILLVVLIVVSLFINWNSVFNTDLYVRPMVMITFVFMVINFILALSNNLLYALHLSELVGLRSCLVQGLNIIGLFIIKRFSSGNLTYMAILFGASTSIIYIYNSISIMKKRPFLIPRKKYFTKSKIDGILSFGLVMFVIQITSVFITTSQNLLVSNFFGASAVTPVSLVNGVYATGYSIIAAIVVPLWSKTTDSISKGEFNWIRKAMKKVRYISLVFIIGFIIVAIFFKDLSYLWLRREIEYQKGIIATTCLYYIVQVIILNYQQFYYGMGKVKIYMWIAIFQSVLMIPLSFILAKLLNFDATGVKLASTLLFSVSAFVLPFLTHRTLNALEKEYKQNEDLI